MTSDQTSDPSSRRNPFVLRTRVSSVLHSLATNAWFAYLTLFALQFKVVYGMWFFRDLTSGDTSAYFTYASIFHSTFRDQIAWSPLYTTFYGTLLNFSHDAYFVTILHRLIIIFAVSLLMLAVMRRLLPHSIAWLVTAWWVILPINFDALYEVHLFAVIPTLIVFLVALYKPTIWTRGAALGLFLLTSFLMRNEVFIATGLWFAACLIWEVYSARKQGARSLGVYLRAYALPVITVFVVVLLFYVRAQTQFPQLSAVLSEKHTLNVCQIYAYNYQQRHTDFTGSPWTQCQDLMTRVFGVPEPSMTEAIGRNPRAMLAYFAWNVRLIPDGLQVLLFNATSGTGQPDYVSHITGAWYALVLSLLLLVILIAGVRELRRNDWWNRWIKARAWGWIALLCMAVVMVVVMLTQRPRPSYLINLFVLIAALVGMGAFVLIDRWIGIKRFSLWMPVVAVVLIALVPPYFTEQYRNSDDSTGRYLLLRYERLAPFKSLLTQPNMHLLTYGWSNDLCSYIAVTGCTPLDYRDFMAAKPADVTIDDWLTQEQITLFYVDDYVFADPAAQLFLANPEAAGWDVVTQTQTEGSHWELLKRDAAS